MKNITIIGTGYVGLVTGVGLSEFGNKVICVDINQSKINDLNAGKVPIYEPGLLDLIRKNVNSERLFFSSDIASSIKESEVIIIAVGTPQSKNGSADLKYVFDALDSISENLNSYKVIVTKSTVPIGTGEKIITKLKKKYEDNIDFDYVSNPEFLREGSAVKDFLWPDRVIIGTNNEKALQIMRDIYRPLYINKNPIQRTAVETSEMIKYASNSFLALKISFINEIANLCESVGADVHDVAIAMGKDGRISDKFLHPGPGFGGSCFPKDLEALLSLSKEHSVTMETLQAAIKANRNQKERIGEKLDRLVSGGIKGKKIAILGLAFKANTDDVRESSTIDLIKFILNQGGFVNAYDPIANESMAKIFNDIHYFDNVYDAICEVDALVIMTEWNEFRALDLNRIKKSMRNNYVLDTRNILNMKELSEQGFVYDNIGRIKI
ncbi:UDP-glucose/GDP-mannose dehydrogenase family protein [bacterium]|nr:UDP-glucose/GDP-mannose dehydrogenase family protein [bacterium]MBT6017731.1 UDP-glucose/GDP-mannose dehydrogenase family protein [bacterium]